MKVNKNLVDIYKKDVIKESKLMQQYIAWFDSLRINPLLSYFTQDDIKFLHNLAVSPAMHCNVKEKYRLIGELMQKRGFKLIGGGTNRRAYECIYDSRVVAKVATDYVGFTSNLKEYVNQNVLKPFCNKIFEVTPCGTLAIIEAVVPIKDKSEFQKYAPEIFDILYFKIRNNNIAMDDIGTSRFKNWGYRTGFGPVLLDYPSMYVADPKKRLCKDILNNCLCSGTLDYDEGFNNIVCSECGKTYLASTLSKPDGDDIKSLLSAVGYRKQEGVKKMKVIISSAETGDVLYTKESNGTSNYVDSANSNFVYKNNPYSQPIVNDKPKNKKRRVIISSLNDDVKNDIPSTIVYESSQRCETQESRRAEFMRKFNLINSGNMNFEQVIDSDNIPTTDFINAVNNMIITDNPFITEEEAMSMYKKLQTATLNIDKNVPNILNESNIRIADTMLNSMLRKISNASPSDDMFIVFYKLILNVKNTKTFFDSIINFWNILLELNSFDSDVTDDCYTFCVYEDIYDIFKTTVEKALNDYRYNIVLSGNFTYNTSNILLFINLGVSEMKFIVENDIDTTKWYTISFSNDYSEQVFCVRQNDCKTIEHTLDNFIKNINKESEEESLSDSKKDEDNIEIVSMTKNENYDDSYDITPDEENDNVVQEEETESSNEVTLTPVQQYEMVVSGNEKQGTSKQQNRYNNNNNKKKKNRRR